MVDPNDTLRAKTHEILSRVFGYERFRYEQEAAINATLSKQDVLCVMPTGAGKSLCYQVPALLFEGLTVVISPLISLMKDQVNALQQMGVSVAYLNSSQTPEESRQVIEQLYANKIKLLYVAPERLMLDSFIAMLQRVKISFLAVDEAHCISQWGQDFRTSYLHITNLLEMLPARPSVGAYTATATDNVKSDIIRLLGLNAPLIVNTGFDRPNLYFEVIKTREKDAALLEIMAKRNGESGIVYCSSRKNTEAVHETLLENGYRATKYHAGLTKEERQINQDKFIDERADIIVATNAFGMGIDKSNVRFVVHYNMPKDIESYYQEAGRAGRDGLESDCILLYSPADVHLNDYLINHTEENPDYDETTNELVRQARIERLRQMTFYSTTSRCLRTFLLNYFGEHAVKSCGNCSNCNNQLDEKDITIDAQKILSCVVRCRQRFGMSTIIEVLRGQNTEKIRRYGLDTLSTYNLMGDRSTDELRFLCHTLIELGFLEQTNSQYLVLKINANSKQILRGEKQLTARVPKPSQLAPTKSPIDKPSRKAVVPTKSP